VAKILLVEDDQNLREIFEMRLQAEGYQTLVAGDGEEALVVAMKEKPDLIIADVMMPKLSGFEMLETLRAAPEMANVKVVMMTALGQAEDQARGQKLGVVKYLVKSQVTLEDFVRVVREVLQPDQAGAAAQAAPAIDPALSNSIVNKQGSPVMQDDQTTNPDPSMQPPAGGSNGMPASEPTSPPTGMPADGDAKPMAQEKDEMEKQAEAWTPPADTPAAGGTAPTAGPADTTDMSGGTGSMTTPPAEPPKEGMDENAGTGMTPPATP